MSNRVGNITGHGSASDRGGADSWYGRGRCPHYYMGATGDRRVGRVDMTQEERDAYNRAYDENESDPMARKQWD